MHHAAMKQEMPRTSSPLRSDQHNLGIHSLSTPAELHVLIVKVPSSSGLSHPFFCGLAQGEEGCAVYMWFVARNLDLLQCAACTVDLH